MRKQDLSIQGYRQAPGAKVWEVLPNLSLEKVEQMTQPKKNGEENGKSNVPAAGAKEPAETETRIVYLAEEHLATINDMATKELTDIDRQINDCVVNRADAFHDLETAADTEFQRYLLLAKPELQKLRVEERRQLRDLKFFKARNGLDRLAAYPESLWLHVAFVAVAVLVECVFNTYFFAAGSELGQLGGFFQALLISAGNVATALVVGRLALTNLHHVDWRRVTAGAAGFIAWIAGVTAYHLLVAHYRDTLAIDTQSAIVGALDSFATSPLHLESLDSVLVLVIGAVISLIALIDGYKFDDPYPGYGEQDRRYQQKRRAYEAKEVEVRQRLAATIQDAERRVQERLQTYEAKSGRMTDLITGVAAVVDHFENLYQQVDDIVRAAITQYRTANRKIRTEADPASFASTPQAKRLLEVDKYRRHLGRYEAIQEKTARVLEDIRSHASQVLIRLVSRTEAMMENMENLNADLSTLADQEIAAYNKMEV
jgi:hypothetical protein